MNQLPVRTRAVVGLLADEYLSNEEIGKRLGMATRTVKAHLARAFVAFGIEGNKYQKRLRLAKRFMAPGGEPWNGDALAPRELRAAELVAAGLSNREAANLMGTTEHTVKNYLRSIFDKAGVWNRVELAAWYARHFGRPAIEMENNRVMAEQQA
jgi:DNA-binding CsgD family transcriptional regulator